MLISYTKTYFNLLHMSKFPVKINLFLIILDMTFALWCNIQNLNVSIM